MADSIAELRHRQEKRADESDEKLSLDSDGKAIDDAVLVKEVEALEERLQLDEATDDEYRVGEAWEVALKVSSWYTVIVLD